MQTIARTTFTTVKAVGGLLPADLLQRIAGGDASLPGLRPEDYHLLPGERLNEAVNRAWNRCLGAWQGFADLRRTLPESDTGTTLTRERWLLVLFQELLAAVRALAFTTEKSVRRPVDYRNLDSEEFGSVYESLLELHPRLNVSAATFDLTTGAGSERKTTGSHYTPSPLVNNLLDTALEPVVAERLERVRGE